MSFRSLIAAVFLAGGLPMPQATAHHGGAVEWQQHVEGPVTGIATEFAFRFPHVVVTLEVGDGAERRNWSMVTRWTPTILRKVGWSRSSIEPGDRVTVTYLPHVSDPTVGHMQTIEVNGEALPLQLAP
jgi:hypothetical protein